MKIEKNFVKFYSPGTSVDEITTKEIDSWDVKLAKKMSLDITERYNQKPFGFKFITRGRDDNELDSKEIKSSNFYFLHGKIYTLEEIKHRKNPSDKILISNMKNNNFDRVIECNGITKPFLESDVLI